MLLRFFGRGSAFTAEHNSAFFSDGGSLVLIDHSISAFNKLRKLGTDRFTESGKTDRICVLVTHTHSDHISGIPLLVHYAFYVWDIPVTIAVPSGEVGEQLRYCLANVEGCDEQAYSIVPADSLDWVEKVIPTKHVPSLDGRCFGYLLNIRGKKAVYTGDTNTLVPFLPYIGDDTELYTEISVVDSGVHLFLGDNAEQLKALSEKGVKVFLMHLDDEQFIENAFRDTDISLAPLF